MMNKQPVESSADMSAAQLHRLLQQPALLPPADFVTRVMSEVEAQETRAVPTAEQNRSQTLKALSWWQWLTLLLAGSPGIAQVFTLIFSAWHISNAG